MTREEYEARIYGLLAKIHPVPGKPGTYRRADSDLEQVIQEVLTVKVGPVDDPWPDEAMVRLALVWLARAKLPPWLGHVPCESYVQRTLLGVNGSWRCQVTFSLPVVDLRAMALAATQVHETERMIRWLRSLAGDESN